MGLPDRVGLRMRDQIARARLLHEAAPSSELADRLALLRASHDLNTPDQKAELFAIQDILRGRSRRGRR